MKTGLSLESMARTEAKLHLLLLHSSKELSLVPCVYITFLFALFLVQKVNNTTRTDGFKKNWILSIFNIISKVNIWLISFQSLVQVNLQKTVRLLANTDPIANEAVQRRLLLPPSYNHNSSGLAVNLSDSNLQAYLTDGNYITISLRWQQPQQHQH